MTELAAPVNIFSGEAGLGGALTNPTELARAKGTIQQAYPIFFAGKRYPDVETAYHLLADKPDVARTDALMAELIAAKFRQHPGLLEAVRDRGGKAWLLACSHWTGAASDSAKAWEGAGQASRFIRNLASGFEQALGQTVYENAQQVLF